MFAELPRLDGAAGSQIIHYSVIGSDQVWENHKKSSIAVIPHLVNGFRPYGTSDVNVTFVME